MTFVKCFDAIDVVIGDLERVVDIVRNTQCEEILDLFQRAKEQECLQHYVLNLEAIIGVDSAGTNDVPQVNEWLLLFENNQKDLRML